jgi:pentatricopeptide repeat protein
MESDVFLTNALVDMYAKCGLVSHAELVFDLALQGNARRGDAMLLTEMYGQHGQCKDVIQM